MLDCGCFDKGAPAARGAAAVLSPLLPRRPVVFAVLQSSM